ncbi:hypothetical protein GCM10007939_03850 [Amylibacter marinus]|uniref:Uncharacterized protein n=1 Tax=Amylibacter marinus TaxID=1475483 RepID=A0ABQ5VS52_9RHOB|nr:hypothetical protein [Amylibacter marinus]GLQ34102.1 hypothetical protein GCM10007939_03850 [Amylibacter marinus]
MRNTALILGIISGLWGMVVGFFAFGYTVLVDSVGEKAPDLLTQVDDVEKIRVFSLIAPVLALVGGGMVHARPTWSGPLLLLSAAGMLYAFEWRFWTMFPITLCAIAGILAFLAAYTKSD